jgi:lysozyme
LELAHGVDISKYQWFVLPNLQPDLSRPIDFHKMKAGGISFAYVRATTIDGQPDYAFEENWAGLKSVGIPRGAYGFANQKDPLGYAIRLHKVVSATGDLGELPPALDFECRFIPKTKSYIGKMTYQACHDWLLHTEALFGRRPIIYTSYSMWFSPPPAWTTDYELWVASYSAVNGQPKWMPAGWKSWRLWQQGTPSTGKKLGVQSEEIDWDVFAGNENNLHEWAGLAHEPTLEERVSALEIAVFGKGG